MTYEFETWETINLPTVTGDTNFIIYDHTTNTPNTDQTGIIYSGLVRDGYQIKNLNEILGQYVHPIIISFTSSVQTDNTAYYKFYIYYTQDDWVNFTYDTIILTYNWGYENEVGAVLSYPIINLVDYRQWFLYTVKAGTPDTETTIYVKLEDTIEDSFVITGYTHYNYVQDLSTWIYPAEFSYAYSYDFFVDTSNMLPNTYNTITIGASKYIVTNTCYKYCIYYLNQFGGWDSLLFRGKELQIDNLKRWSYKQNYIAGQSNSFNQVDYLTKIQESWELNTSYLDDLQSARMIQLLGSNKLFLHDLETNIVKPVNITNSNCEHKTYKNQGRKMSYYTINVTNSQPKYRV